MFSPHIASRKPIDKPLGRRSLLPFLRVDPASKPDARPDRAGDQGEGGQSSLSRFIKQFSRFRKSRTSQVEIAPSSVEASGMVIAARGDGLGARLCALVKAVALARKLNLPFRFMWPPPLLDPEFNAVSSLESIFSQSFIDDHLDDSLFLGEFIAIDHEPVTRA
jgi:hypothetical protein